MSNEIERWRELGTRLGVEVTAPAIIPIADVSATFTALLPQFGGNNGMIADPHWEAISAHADALVRLGYGFSAVEIGSDPDAESLKEMLRDWAGQQPRQSPLGGNNLMAALGRKLPIR